MNLKQLFNNIINPRNWVYFIQGYFRLFIKWLYHKIYNDNKLEEMMYAVYVCPDCYANNSCEECGCDFMALFSSDKKCKRHE